MRAVWSFWSKPFREGRESIWKSRLDHLLAWVLSVESARKHYPETALHTDDEGARMLVDGIGLEFVEVSTDLNALADHDPEWWALGKLWAYRAQREPFVHIDYDAFLWKRLPARMESAPILAQNPEYFVTGASYYKPELLERAILGDGGGWLPGEWLWYRATGGVQRAESCGIVGGTHVEFIRHYAAEAIAMIEHPRNRERWALLADRSEHNVLIEQYFLSACIEYHRHREGSPYRALDVEYLFTSLDDAFMPGRAAEMGYTHLIADSKRNDDIASRLRKRVMRDYPEMYGRCVEYLRGEGVVADRAVET
jgi:hypothetical protein